MNPVSVSLATSYTGAGPTPWVFFSGGTAAFELVGTVSGTVTLQKLGPDGTTVEAVGASTTVTATAFVQGLSLPAGVYRLGLSASMGPLTASLSASLD